MSIKILLEDWEDDWKETLKSENLNSFFSCEMYMIVHNGIEQMTINIATLYGTALLSIAASVIDMIANKENKTFRISGFSSAYDYFFIVKGREIKIEAVNVTNDRVEFFLFYDKTKFAHDFVKALKKHLQQIAQMNNRIREQETYKLLEQKLHALNAMIWSY
ncbi:ribonucleoside-triphosphate reductase [Anoxybacillus ayderensis]|uniref:ribonucleoside-triphosphate reductase n=1 Tax=Anoxybacillus ayderensis TaxID=265546 RepID=UPI002E1D6627|nr:ribonucleoside-triphosphate reductase [Anoxybacillus ayderensis]